MSSWRLVNLRIRHCQTKYRLISRLYSRTLQTKTSSSIQACFNRGFCSVIHPSTPPVFDSKVGFVDYEKEWSNYRIEVPKFFNFANVLDGWAEKDEVSVLYCNSSWHYIDLSLVDAAYYLRYVQYFYIILDIE